MVSAWSDSNENWLPQQVHLSHRRSYPPAGESAIIHKRETKVLAPGYGTDSTERVGHGGFSEIIEPPGDDLPSRVSAKLVVTSCCYRGHVGQAWWQTHLPKSVISQATMEPSLLSARIVEITCRNGNHIRQSWRNSPAPYKVFPSHDATVAFQR